MHKLTADQITYLTQLRHTLHRRPEISGEERATAARMVAELEELGADRIWQGLGGHGVAAEFRGAGDGPTVLLRCELDGLPIQEISDLPYRSEVAGKGHLCGHDGHMVSLLGVAMGLAKRPKRGRVILLFQPAEETGAGAQAVIDDPRWPEIRPDFAFAYHNVPGWPLGQVGLRDAVANCASRGLQINLEGKSSHAAAPEDGLSPGPAMADLMVALPALGEGQIGDDNFALSTLTHARLGEACFGIAPALGELRVTLRSMTNARMGVMISEAEAALTKSQGELQVRTSWHDVFHAVENDRAAMAVARRVLVDLGMDSQEMQAPMRWSEDFGRFGEDGAQAALLFIGSGIDQPQLHNPDYDFPDALVPVVTELWTALVADILGE
ncbi:putative hydrolase YxeP [Pelagimonas phthalicica]|uniref:Putative hydrolase YxeP n=1 Tax=Pelagimonas phthalicica TaxID=1037362 RepID=A0A238JHC1_9RHOB|nr:amidohydrolase [Pelagimonas phthalicica]TDS89893.1 amidohydrolase [Pelagimonas phthalicica]SMX30060.1 putative hydrolase YxeP [Pelagimonas phthalicica]